MAEDRVDRRLEVQPTISIEWIERYVPYTAAMAKFIDGMRKAGLE